MFSGLHRKLLPVVLIAGTCVWLFQPALARTKPRLVAFDRDYSSALATADRFLHAWQMRDAESGILLLTDRVREHTAEDQMQEFFSAERSTSSSFEIGRGKRLAANRYEFPIALFLHDTGKTRELSRPKASSLIVVKIGRDDWAVDKLP